MKNTVKGGFALVGLGILSAVIFLALGETDLTASVFLVILGITLFFA